MARITAVLRFIFAEFGPLVVFWGLAFALGTKAAIAGAVLFIIADAIRRRILGIAFTRIYMLAGGLTVVFGTVDLLASTPFMLKYEAVVTNFATGIAFVIGARGPKPMIQEVAEQRQGGPFPEGADITRFFQYFTLLWAFYFFAKAAFYSWTAWTMPLLQAMAVRSLVGSVSLGLMIALSVTQGRRIFLLCRWLGWLPERAANAPPAGPIPNGKPAFTGRPASPFPP
jgi:intracellular septation protein A